MIKRLIQLVSETLFSKSPVNILRILILTLFFSALAQAQILDTASAGESYRTQGEYYGKVGGKPYGIQVISFSGGKFDMNILPGGLPGQGWGDNLNDFLYLQSSSSGPSGTIFIGSGPAAGWTLSIPAGGRTIVGSGPGNASVDMKKIYRKSTTENLLPPAGAIVLFDGTQSSYSANWTGKPSYSVNSVNYLAEGNNALKYLADHTLHIEFFTPYMPDKDGGERGNSGVYIQGSYEAQIEDSFGWMRGSQESGSHGKSTSWMGALYGVNSPKVNMAHPPLTWQTYDIYTTSAVYNGQNKVAPARITVYLNGFKVQDTTIAGPTDGGFGESALGGKMYVQNHGAPMYFRNAWALPGKNFLPVPALPSLDPVSILNLNRKNLLSKNSPAKIFGLNAITDGELIFNLNGKRMTPTRMKTGAGLFINTPQ